MMLSFPRPGAAPRRPCSRSPAWCSLTPPRRSRRPSRPRRRRSPSCGASRSTAPPITCSARSTSPTRASRPYPGRRVARADADALYVEVLTANKNSLALMPKLMLPGARASRRSSARAPRGVQAYCEGAGLPFQAMRRFKPWVLSMNISLGEVMMKFRARTRSTSCSSETRARRRRSSAARDDGVPAVAV